MKAKRGEVVVVTGASAGVGRAVVQEFARHGAKVALIAREPERLEAARREALALGAREALAIPLDVVDADGIERAAERVERELGPIDVWVNDAMATVFAPFLETEPEEFHRATEVTYLGYVWGTRAALRRMVPRDRGTVVQVGSALAYRAIPLQSAYCGAKHAIRGFTDSVRTELLHRKSRVWITMVQLPAVNTPQFDWSLSRLPNRAQPVPPIYQPDVPARAVYWAAHHRRREHFVGGSTLLVIWLNRFLAGLGDRYLARTGYRSQQTAEPRDRRRPNNLWRPVPGDPGAHGRFDRRASRRSFQLWLSEHRTALAGAAAAALVTWLLGKHAEPGPRAERRLQTSRRSRTPQELSRSAERKPA